MYELLFDHTLNLVTPMVEITMIVHIHIHTYILFNFFLHNNIQDKILCASKLTSPSKGDLPARPNLTQIWKDLTCFLSQWGKSRRKVAITYRDTGVSRLCNRYCTVVEGVMSNLTSQLEETMEGQVAADTAYHTQVIRFFYSFIHTYIYIHTSHMHHSFNGLEST